jgi:hypothetical protein
MKELALVQSQLNAPKNQFNKFGGYKYRSAEDILEAVKPLLKQVNAIITITDDIIPVGDRIYVKATATFIVNDKSISTTAFAREEETKKGMDASQITGSASSYARKYALNGLLLIDDNKDADATNTHGKEQPASLPKKEKSLDERKLGLMQFYQKNPNKLADIFVKMDLIDDAGLVGKDEIYQIIGELTANQIDNIKAYL